jgi:Ca2+-binding EF-hand superfamily protein
MYLNKNKREMKMKVSMNLVNELYLLGYQNLLSVLCVAPVGYSLYEMTVLINYSITNNAHEKRPTIIVATICGLSWLFSIAIITNVLPRFFLSGLLIYAGLPFLELIFAAYERITKKEFITVLVIVFTNFFFELFESTKSNALVIAVILGFLLSSVAFLIQYSKTSIIRDSLSGKDYQSSVVRSYQEQLLVERLGVRYAIVELEGYIFFGSCNQIVNWAKDIIHNNNKKTDAEKIQYIIIDLKHVENIDYTGSSAISRVLVPLLLDGSCQVIFSDMSIKVRRKLSDVFQVHKHVKDFHDLDHASEYVENILLERAAILRQNWLLFPSFSRLHTQAVLKNTYEIFEAILGGQGNRLWRYAEQLKFPPNYFITREGRYNHTLYLLQKGKVTTFRDGEGGKGRGEIHRIRTLFRGAFVNEECLFSDAPVQHCTVTNQECIIWAIDRENMKRLEATDPNLMAAILRHVLSTSSLAKNRLEREVAAIDQSVPRHPHHDMQQQLASNTMNNFGNRLLEEIRDMHEHHVAEVHDVELDENFAHVTGAGSHHLHHFHHMNVDVDVMGVNKNSSEAFKELSKQLEWKSIRPHLSTTERRDAIECFLFHSILDETASMVSDQWEDDQDNDQNGVKIRKKRGSMRARSYIDITRKVSRVDISKVESSDDNLSNLSGSLTTEMYGETKSSAKEKEMREIFVMDTDQSGGANSGKSSPLGRTVTSVFEEHARTAIDGKYISLEEVQRAVMDLGMFPTSEEINQLHEQYKRLECLELDLETTNQLEHARNYGSADIDEFLKIVTSLSVKEMSSSTVGKLHRLFVKHSDEEQRLWREDLPNLMKTLNHPEDELEMELLMKEWDIDMRGYLDFDAFVSIVAHLLKQEELDEQLERDFLTFCGETNVQQPSLQQRHSRITSANIVRVARARNVFMDHQTAEEMIFDADESGTGKLSLDSLIACIETVGADEEYKTV